MTLFTGHAPIPDVGTDFKDLRATRKASPQTIDPVASGDSALVHPDVLDVGEQWNGYRYWLAITPYLNSDSQYENPCIMASNDAYTWEVPAGLTNPIAGPPGTGNYSDPDLHMSPDGTTLRCVFRHTTTGDDFVVSESTDGTTWSAPTTVYDFGAGGTYLSPSVVHDGSQYVMYYLDPAGATTRPIMRRTASTITGTWSSATTVWEQQLGNDETPWHLDVILVDGTYYMLVDGEETTSGLWLLKSSDGITWTVGDTAVMEYGYTGTWDRNLYRSTIWPIWIGSNLTFGMYYGSNGGPSSWQVARADLFDGPAREAAQASVISTVQAGNFPALIADGFDRADASSLGTSDTGQSWTLVGGGLSITSGEAHATTAGNNRATIPGYASDGVLRFVVEALGGEIWMIARFTSTSNYVRIGTASGTARLQTIEAGAIVTNVFAGSVTGGDAIIAKLDGSSIKVFVNEKEWISETVAFNSSATTYGLQLTDPTGRVDDFSLREL